MLFILCYNEDSKVGGFMKKSKILIFIVFIILCIIGVLMYLYLKQDDSIKKETEEKKEEPIVEVKKLKIVNEESNSRNYAVMINNHDKARVNHAGLEDAYIVYEAIVEGGLTRMMAIFKDKETARIGSVRSARHYFLDYAMENDAIYVHFGWSPQAQSDIKSLGINNINGLYDNVFWRDYSLGVPLEHTAFTKMESIKNYSVKKGYRTTSDKELLLNYNVDEVNINERDGATAANQIDIVYSSYVTSSYTYDSQNKVYLRSVNGSPHMTSDENKNKTQITVKNIIIADMNNYSIDSYGRQNLSNIGSGNGYYITNGYAVPIQWFKDSRGSQTIYKYLDGSEIQVNDGNTYIQLHPSNQNINIY